MVRQSKAGHGKARRGTARHRTLSTPPLRPTLPAPASGTLWRCPFPAPATFLEKSGTYTRTSTLRARKHGVRQRLRVDTARAHAPAVARPAQGVRTLDQAPALPCDRGLGCNPRVEQSTGAHRRRYRLCSGAHGGWVRRAARSAAVGAGQHRVDQRALPAGHEEGGMERGGGRGRGEGGEMTHTAAALWAAGGGRKLGELTGGLQLYTCMHSQEQPRRIVKGWARRAPTQAPARVAQAHDCSHTRQRGFTHPHFHCSSDARATAGSPPSTPPSAASPTASSAAGSS
jgi:hypothetical protein